jgi:LEA14-like dessication related protein
MVPCKLDGAVSACLAGIIAVVVGCAGGQVKQESGPGAYQKPAFEYRGINFENQSFSGMTVLFRFELVSTDKRPARLKGCSYTLDLKGSEPIKGTVTPEGQLGPGARIAVETPVALPWPSDKAEMQAFLGRKKVSYKFFQECKIETEGGEMTASASDSGSIPLPKLPELTVSGANAEHFGRSDIRLNFELSFVNENPFSVMVDKIVYKITVEGKVLSEGSMPVVESIPPSNEASYDISTGTLSGEASREIMKLVSKPSLGYHLEGQVFMGEFEIPVDATGTISFSH